MAEKLKRQTRSYEQAEQAELSEEANIEKFQEKVEQIGLVRGFPLLFTCHIEALLELLFLIDHDIHNKEKKLELGWLYPHKSLGSHHKHLLYYHHQREELRGLLDEVGEHASTDFFTEHNGVGEVHFEQAARQLSIVFERILPLVLEGQQARGAGLIVRKAVKLPRAPRRL